MELHGSDRRFGRTLSLNALALRVINDLYVYIYRIIIIIIITIYTFD